MWRKAKEWLRMAQSNTSARAVGREPAPDSAPAYSRKYSPLSPTRGERSSINDTNEIEGSHPCHNYVDRQLPTWNILPLQDECKMRETGIRQPKESCKLMLRYFSLLGFPSFHSPSMGWTLF
ncbi:hypothetical protein J6590_002476 [Homalodisca vitripennis]|nr:hypothetical protein J6590_002476 [Homalodisca vitripennis]